jgi:hypothetical protein
MVTKTVSTIIDELNRHINHKYSTKESKVIVSNLIDQSGNIPEGNIDKIVCSLINMKVERMQQNSGFTSSRMAVQIPPKVINLFFMFSSAHIEKNYLEGIELLSTVTNFFEGKSLFTTQNTPNLPSQIMKVSAEIFNPKLEHLSHLWQALGAKYMPSTIYQVRIYAASEDLKLDAIPSIKSMLP